MYQSYFGLSEKPFSIAPDPHYLYMSTRHKEAMAHLSYGLSQGGCFIVLSGEVGTGKTTLCRNLLADLPENVDVALILNANINEIELLQTICDELKITYKQKDSQKQLLDQINTYLLKTFSENRHTVLIIDEAQLLSRNVLEQIRLLTNLETTKSKLLQIILIGQSELNQLLSRNDLRQLAQRVTARYHLGALRQNEIEDYINFRLSVAGCKKALFSKQALNKIHQLTNGIPRKINVLADHALLAAYSKTSTLVDAKTVKAASNDVFFDTESNRNVLLEGLSRAKWPLIAGLAILLNIGLWWWFVGSVDKQETVTISYQASPEINIEKSEETVQQNNYLNQQTQAVILDVANNNSSFLQEKVKPNDELDDSPQTEKGVMIVSEELLDYSPELPIQQDTLHSSQVSETVKMTDNLLTKTDIQLPAEQLAIDPAISKLGKLLETSSDLTSRIGAFRNLAGIWQVPLTEKLIQPACNAIANHGLTCLRFSDWAELKNYNRPAILVLDHQDQLHRVILRSIEGETATVLIGDTQHQIKVTVLQSRWTNNGVLLWRPSKVGVELRKLGDQKNQIVALREYLNQALAKAQLPLLDSIETTEFDMDMSQKVFALQTRFNIAGDSRIGDQTYMLMNEIVEPSITPVLIQRLP